jgi:hypothetical protein
MSLNAGTSVSQAITSVTNMTQADFEGRRHSECSSNAQEYGMALTDLWSNKSCKQHAYSKLA